MTRRAALRASDADRERIAERLRQAATEGRLLPDELDERLGVALSAKTYGELDGLVADLPAPVPAPAARVSTPARRRPAVPVAVLVILVLLVAGAVASAVTGHAHGGHGGPQFIWIVFVALGWRYFSRRRAR